MDPELLNDLKDYIINTSDRNDECIAMALLKRLNGCAPLELSPCNNLQ